MKRFARVSGGIVQEIAEIPDEMTVADLFHPSLTFIPCGDDVGERWVHVDGVFAPPPPPAPVIPSVVTMRQIRLALYAAGLLDGVNAALADVGGPIAIEWEYGTTVARSSPLVDQITTAIDMPAAETDALFVAASVL